MSSGAGKRLEKRRGLGTKESRDPFAVDFFDTNSGVSKRKDRGKTDESRISVWHSGLESVGKDTSRNSLSFDDTPYWAENAINSALKARISSFSKLSSNDVNFRVIGVERVNYSSETSSLLKRGNSLVGFAAEGQIGTIAIGRVFVSDLIDTFLKGSPSKARVSNQLTQVEQTILRYLVIEVVSAFNEEVSDACDLELIDFGSTGNSDVRESEVIEIVGELVVGGVSGMVTILLPLKLLQEIGAEIESEHDLKSHNKSVAERWNHFVKGLDCFVEIGTAALSLSEIRYLETGDVVLCESDANELWSKTESETVLTAGVGTLRFGVVTNRKRSSVRVDLGQAPETVSNAESRILIRQEGNEDMANDDFEGIGLDALVKDNDNRGEESPEPKIDLDSITVDLKIRFAGRKISLAELGGLQNGQVLEIGCKPDDPVEIVAENSGRPVATGQLVKVDDQLGVRVTRVFV